jgi:DNA topoisomerase-2
MLPVVDFAFSHMTPDIHELKAFIGHVCEQTAYYHGEQSLSLAIIGLAQDFVGTNNVNLLVPHGHFGCRHFGHKESGASRYLSCALNSITHALILPEDNCLLNYNLVWLILKLHTNPCPIS